ncbi:hypothetical protein Nepgr_016075 [Nepenthes gracilis]|uniref:ABC-type xenobiotic transporter n=1 Tax=Nepenthes gracilis TaxID=150966 RepID=A0AAD3XRQ1_NEPGR|nr:hypothetical protein Nepgr_016075 [Nepenthes gracilis]
MASPSSSLGIFTGICGGQFDLSSSCIQKTVIDAVNLLFVLIFYLFLLLSSISKNRSSERTRRRWVSVFVSCCCAIIGLSYFGAGLWNLLAEDGNSEPLIFAVYAVRGLVWISLAVSSIVQISKWIRILCAIWWLSFFLLASSLNISMLLTKKEIQILDILSWPVNFFLLLRSFENLGLFVTHSTAEKIVSSEPLLPEKGQAKSGKAGFISRLIFLWINPLLRLGYSKPLVLDDIPCLFPEDEANLAYQKFKDTWEDLKRKSSNIEGKKNLVIEVMAKVYMKEMVYMGIGAFFKTLAVSVSPLLLYAFVRYSNQAKESLQEVLSLLAILIVVKVFESLSQRHWFFQARRTGMRIRSALMVAVYQKQLKLSSLGRRSHSTGEIVNYVVVDAYRMSEFPWWFHTCWAYAVQLFLSIGVLFGVVGIGALPGLVPLLICALLNVPFAKLLQNCQSQAMKAQDERLRATSEILNNMKVIKLQSWEEKFKNLMESLRGNEIKWVAKSQYIRATGSPLFWMCPTIISAVVFVGCTLFGSTALNAATIFTVLATLRTMSEPVRLIPEALSALIQVLVSFHRINAFLLEDELKNDEVERSSSENPETGIAIRKGNFSWEPESTTLTLREINLEVRRGQKVAVCGSVGAGKSSLLYAILNEIPKVTGNVSVTGSIAYVSQTSWIQSGTVRDNILYGKPMDRDQYEKAIKASALDKDLCSFKHNDLTEIGQRGINLSGGQKQRVQLARAVYNDADIYLLDDPFSAVDAHTAAILFNDCVMDALEEKTVVLVTHQVEFLTAADQILVIEDGRITQCGSYNELLTAGTAFERLVNAHKDALTVPVDSKIDHESSKRDLGLILKASGSNHVTETNEGEISAKGLPEVQLTEEEEKEIGDVGWKPYLTYIFLSNGLASLCIAALVQALFVGAQAASTYWLAFAIQIPNISSAELIGVYAGISALCMLFVYLRSCFIAHLGLKASKAFFAGFISSIFKAPMLFFDSTPIGRIFARVSSDLSILDNEISFGIGFVLCPAFELIAIIIVMASITWPVLIVAILALVASKYVQGYYLTSAREIVRINGTTKAPVMNYVAETSLGVTTIRAFNMVDRFFWSYLKLVDTDAKLFFYSNALTEWLILRIEVLQNLNLFVATFLLLLLPKDFVAPGLVGLSLSYALVITGTHVFMTRIYCNLANYIISVERIKQFMNIEPEPPAIIDENRPPSSWPSEGRIELQDLKVRYQPNAPLVLKGITCTIQESTRVGVVGRTGSGKTTLISALFRLVEPESGIILVDGLNICSIGLKDLRTKLSIIPQEPTLFRGNVRSNLDPLGLYSDSEIWEALDKCQLKETINSLPKQLESSVSDEGENWSSGQRQLFCLGRVLLKRNRVLVLDEATASIDSATDATLQKIIRKEFSKCTVLTVAHRVPTVIDSDMVMVLSNGRLVEYDEPPKLMQKNSSFSKLVAEYWSSRRRNSLHNINYY